MGKVYHTELFTSFSKNSQTYPQMFSKTQTKKLTHFEEICEKLFTPFVIVIIFIFIFSIYVFTNLSGKLDSKLKVYFLNIGQGDAIFIQTQSGNSMLIDSGPQNEKVIAEVQKFKNLFNRNINILLATHADADHIGSMKKVMEKFNFQKFAFSGLSSDTEIFRDLMNKIESQTNGQSKLQNPNQNQKLLTLTAGMSVVLDPKNNVRFDVLFPDFDYQIDAYQKCQSKNDAVEKIRSANKSKLNSNLNSKTRSKVTTKNSCLKFLSIETNLNSVVGKLTFGSTSFMLTGDAPMEVEHFIIKKYGDGIRSDVLKLGHHGSKSSTAPEFLNEVSPNFVVISVGAGNRYGHPHKIVLDNIDVYKMTHSDFVKTLRTDLDGTISFGSDGSSIFLESN